MVTKLPTLLVGVVVICNISNCLLNSGASEAIVKCGPERRRHKDRGAAGAERVACGRVGVSVGGCAPSPENVLIFVSI